ncbi:MAG TPA: carboxypeptidase regulatory-like domain-containing protein [Actinomycetota bacterium]
MRRPAIVSVLALGMLAALMPVARAGVLQISGTISSPGGQPLQGVFVDDGGQTAVTDADGVYWIQEVQFGTYTLGVSKQGLTSDSATVTLSATSPSATRNFTLAYLTSVTLPDPYVSTAQGPATVTATLRTWAPNPEVESCARITDSRTGTTETMDHDGSENGQQVWRYTPSLPVGSPEGTYTLNARVDDCAGTRIDTGAQPVSYVIDNTPPLLYGVSPADDGNLALPVASLQARATDSGSGIQGDSATVTISDMAVPGSPVVIASSWDASTAQITSAEYPFTVRHRYAALVQIQDRAGNVGSVTSEFLAMRYSFSVLPTVTVRHGVPQSETLPSGEIKWLFPDVTVHSGAFTATLTGSAHAGWGNVPFFLDLSQVKVRYTVDGLESPLYEVPVSTQASNWPDDLIVAQQIAVLEAGDTDMILQGAPGEKWIGAVSVTLPAGSALPIFDVAIPYVGVYDPGAIPSPPSACTIQTCPPVGADYLITYLSSPEASKLIQARDAGKSSVKCMDNQNATDRPLCLANPEVSLMVPLQLLTADGESSWHEGTEYAWWAAGQHNPRPTTADAIHQQQFGQQSGPVGAQSAWATGLCGIAYCTSSGADVGWLYSAIPCESDCTSVDDSSNSVHKCVDENGEPVAPDSTACRQAGLLEVSDRNRNYDKAVHDIYVGWHRSKGTADGREEDLAVKWSMSDEAAEAKYLQSSPVSYIGAHPFKAVDVNGDGYRDCGRNQYGPISDKTTHEFRPKEWSLTEKQPVRLSAERFTGRDSGELGEMISYVQHWYEWDADTCWSGTEGNRFQSNYDVTWQTVTSKISFRATAQAKNPPVNYYEDNKGHVIGYLYHRYGRNDWYATACGITRILTQAAGYAAGAPGIAASAAADFFLGNFICDIQEREWSFDVITNQDY